MVARQEDNTSARVREVDQILDDGLSLASSTFSMSGRSFSNMSITSLDSLQSTPLLEEDNNEKDGVIFDEDYLLSRKEQLTKQLNDEVARSTSMRNRLLHSGESEDNIDGDGELLGLGSACQTFLDDGFVNDKNYDTVSTSDDNTNIDADSDDHSDHSITAVEVSHPPIVDVLDKTAQQQQQHSTPANFQSMNQSMCTMKRLESINESIRIMKKHYSDDFFLGETTKEKKYEDEDTYVEENVAFW